MAINTVDNREMLQVGTMLRGIYRIDAYLASGSFGNTYVATNVEFGEQVAIKEFYMKGISHRNMGMPSISVSNSQNVEQFNKLRNVFKREAKRLYILGKKDNPHIVKVHDSFDENNTSYYVMQYVNGSSFSDMLKRQNAPFDTSWLMDTLLPQVLDALDVMHKSKMLHLDIKPSNLMVDVNGNVLIIDFGSTKQIDPSSGDISITSLSFTTNYAPVELKDGDYKKIGPSTDLFSLGATLYNLATNQKPPSTSAINNDGANAFHFYPGTREDFKKLVMWMMNIKTDNRPKNVDEVRKFLNLNPAPKSEPELMPEPIPEPMPEPMPPAAVSTPPMPAAPAAGDDPATTIGSINQPAPAPAGNIYGGGAPYNAGVGAIAGPDYPQYPQPSDESGVTVPMGGGASVPSLPGAENAYSVDNNRGAAAVERPYTGVPASEVAETSPHFDGYQPEPIQPKSRATLYGIIAFFLTLILAALMLYYFFFKDSKTLGGLKDVFPGPSAADTTMVTDSLMSINSKDTVISFKYTGPIVDGKPNGIGKGEYDMGTYEGPYKDGIREGDSCKFVITKSGQSKGDVYEGSFKNDHYEGDCVYTQKDGYYFKGTARDGDFYNGVWYKKDGRVDYNVEEGKAKQ